MLQTVVARGSPLILLYAFDIATAFLRMLVLSRLLDLREFGIASLLAATYGALEQLTDLSLYRFVLSAPREQYGEALSAAHALSSARGLAVGALAVAIAPIIATAFSVSADWPSFAALGFITFIRSFENIAPRVAERDYQYAPQTKVAGAANILSIAVLLGSLALKQKHNALVLSFFAQAVGFVVFSRVFSSAPYRLRFRSPLFARAWRFGYPLMFNGVGVAVAAQGDRFLVAGMLDLPSLGVYAVLMLATTVPVSVVARLVNSVTVAALFNVLALGQLFKARLELASRLTPVIGAILSVAVLTLMPVVVPLVFGQKFSPSRWMVILLAFAAFVRIARNDPGTALLLNEGRTKRIALANLASISAVPFAAILLYYFRSMESAALGRLAGEIAGLAAIHIVGRAAFRGAGGANLVSFAICAVFLGFASALTCLAPNAHAAIFHIVLFCFLSTGLIFWAARIAVPLAKAGYPVQFRGGGDRGSSTALR